MHYTLKYYMHGSLFFSEKTAVHSILECYMHDSLFFSENTAGYYILECYMRGSSIQVVVFTTKELFRRNRAWQIGLVCKASIVTRHQTRWPNKRISLKDYLISLNLLWIENC